jgi:membrane protease YdiL (CAAX protease family)
VWYVATGRDAHRLAADLPDLLASTPLFVTFLLASQLVLLATTLAAARVAPVPPRGGPGFVRPALPAWGYPALAVGSLVPLAVATGAAELVSLVVPPDETLGRAVSQVPREGAVPFVLFLALVPGLVEEAFFRGYVQRRLLARWPAWAAVGVTAGLFGLLHMHPAHVASAFVLGLWLGAVARRAGSVWPAVLCHASINAAAGAWNLGTAYGDIPDPPPAAAVGVGVVLAVGCFLASVWLLARGPAVRPAEDDWRQERDEGERFPGQR